MIRIGAASLPRATSQFVLHYHAERNHQGLANKIIQPEFPVFPDEGEVACRKRLGGSLRYYYREAAGNQVVCVSGHYAVGKNRATSSMFTACSSGRVYSAMTTYQPHMINYIYLV
jgi:hypothetical protein